MHTAWSLKLRPGIDPGDVADRVTHAVWRTLTARPPLAHLYAGYWIAVRGIVREHLRHACVLGERCDLRCPAFRGLNGCGDLEGFSAAIAADVVCRLDQALAGVPVLPLVARDVPVAIERTLAAVGAPRESLTPN